MAGETLSTKQNPGSILAAFLPKKDLKTTTTATEQTQLSPEAINSVIRSMTESNQGLAALLSGRSASGLYNSTTANLLANDLAARVGERAALGSAPKTTSQTVVQKGGSSQIDPRWMLGLQLVGELFGGGSKDSGSKAVLPKGSMNIGSAFDSLFGTSLFGGTEKKKEDLDLFNPLDNYGGFGFTDQNFADFSLDAFAPTYSPTYSSYTPSLDSFYTGDTLDYTPASFGNYSLGIGNTGLGSSGLTFGFSF